MRKIIFCLCKDCDKQLWIIRSNIAILCAVQKGWKPLKRIEPWMGGKALVVVAISQQLPYLHQADSQWSTLCPDPRELCSWRVSPILGREWVSMLHTHQHHVWSSSEMWRRGGQAVLCGRIFALWMTPDLGSWNWFPHTGFWFLCSLLLLHVAAVFLLSVHWIRMKQDGILLYFSSICPPTPPH